MMLIKLKKLRIIFLLVMMLLLATVPVSWTAAFISNPEVSVTDGTVAVHYTVTGGTTDGIEVTLLVMKKDESTETEPPENIGSDPNFIHIDQKIVKSGEHTFIFPVGVSLKGETLRIFIGGNKGTNLVFTDITLGDDIGSGAAVSGKVRSYNPNNETKLKLIQGSVEEASITIPKVETFGLDTQSFSFEDVKPGVYTLVITKEGHTSFTVKNIIVGNDNVDLTTDTRSEIQVMTMRCGDIDGNNMINDNDLTILWMLTNYNRKASDAHDSICDLNGDGLINDIDLTILWRTENYNKGEVIIP